MRRHESYIFAWSVCILTMLATGSARRAEALPLLGSEEYVEAGGVVINVPEYSVPSFVCWDGDALPDLIVGEGGGTDPGRIRVYINAGTATAPAFSGYFYASSAGAPIAEVPGGCLGVFPRVVYWDSDTRKDLLVGLADGRVKLYLNVGTDSEPVFDGGTILAVGPAGEKVDIDVGLRACPIVHDWDGDGRRDLVIGAYDGRIHVYLNTGTDTEPDYPYVTYVEIESGVDLVVPYARSSPHMADLDGDGIVDLVSGNTDGQVLVYPNAGDDANKIFTTASCLMTDGETINIAGAARSRPFVCDWNGDGLDDVLVGSGDGYVRLFRGILIADIDADQDVDLDDVSVFTDILVGEATPTQGQLLRSDVNQDGAVDGLDVAAFMSAL